MAQSETNPVSGNRLTDLGEAALATTRQILLTFVDLGTIGMSGGDVYRFYRQPLKIYWRWRRGDRQKFVKNLSRLQRQGYLRSYYQDKQLVYVLTKKGKQRAKRASLGEITLPNPAVWDRKWHLIIFDIPERNRLARTVFRQRLKELGFAQLQKSVFVHPFDASDLVSGIRQSFDLGPEIQYVKADQIEQEQKLIKHFMDQDILTKKHFRKMPSAVNGAP